jgi:hypothetical protein
VVFEVGGVARASLAYQYTARSRHGMLKPKERIGANRSAQATRSFPWCAKVLAVTDVESRPSEGGYAAGVT